MIHFYPAGRPAGCFCLSGAENWKFYPNQEISVDLYWVSCYNVN